MAKRAHKILGVELKGSNIVRVTDNVGKVVREELDWSSLDATQQGRLALQTKAKRRLGQ